MNWHRAVGFLASQGTRARGGQNGIQLIFYYSLSLRPRMDRPNFFFLRKIVEPVLSYFLEG
jgi:hypothetical protein